MKGSQRTKDKDIKRYLELRSLPGTPFEKLPQEVKTALTVIDAGRGNPEDPEKEMLAFYIIRGYDAAIGVYDGFV